MKAVDPVDDEHHAIFECSGYGYACGLFPDLFQGHCSTVSHFSESATK